MSQRLVVTMTVFLAAMTVASEASAECAAGDPLPDALELSDYRIKLTEVRRRGDVAARSSRDSGYFWTGAELGELATIAILLNASSFAPGFSCLNMGYGKASIHAQMNTVYARASAEGMPQAYQDGIIGPVHDAAEDFYGSGGTVELPNWP